MIAPPASLFVGVTGASGAPYALRLVERSRRRGCELSLCVSDMGLAVLRHELELGAGGARRGDGGVPRRRPRRGARLRPRRPRGAGRQRQQLPRRRGRLPVLAVDASPTSRWARRARSSTAPATSRSRRAARSCWCRARRRSRDPPEAPARGAPRGRADRAAHAGLLHAPADARRRRRLRGRQGAVRRSASSSASRRRGRVRSDRCPSPPGSAEGDGDGDGWSRDPARSRPRAHRRDVRPHRAALRPHEPADDGRARPPLARGGGASPPRRRRRTALLDACCGTGDLTLALRAPLSRRAPSPGSTSARRCSRGRAPRPPAPSRGAAVRFVRRRPARAALRRRDLRRRDGRLGRAQRRRPRPRLRRDGRAWLRPGARVVCLEATTPRRRLRPALPRHLVRAWSCRPGRPGRRRRRAPTRICRPRSARSPTPTGLAAVMRARRPAERALSALRLRRHGAARRRCARGSPWTACDGAVVKPADILSWRSAAQRNRVAGGLAAVEERLGSVVESMPGRLCEAGRLDAHRRRQAPAAAARAAGGARHRPARRAGVARRRRGRAAAHGDARPRRRARRRRAAPRPADRRPRLRRRDGRRRPATTCSRGLRRARRHGRRACRGAAQPRSPGASPRASGCRPATPFARRVTVDDYLRRCRLKTADLFAAACRLGALLTGLSRRDGRRRSGPSATRSAWRFRSSTTSST